MTPRERRLAVLLSLLIALFVFGGGGYLGVYQPLSESSAAAEKLEQEIGERQGKLDKAFKDKPRLDRALKRSLPADHDVARQEYDAAINRLIKDARVPASAFTVKPKTTEGKTAPEIAPKKPAYTRIALEVTLSRVSYATVLDVLSRYYRLNLLQQISRFTVKKTEDLPSPPLGSSVSDRPDLTVTFVTEAIILDGAENRRSLLPIPNAAGAATGGLGYTALYSAHDVTRWMTPVQWEQVLAVPSRDYSPMLVKDIFHGPPPGPLPPPVTPPVVVKEDTSRFIRLTGLGMNSDGTGSAFIEDTASKQEYAITVTKVGGKLKTEVVKYYYTIKGVRKTFDSGTVLDISDASSRTARKFKVAGIDGDTLVLTEVGSSGSSDSGSRVSYGGRRPGSPATSSRPTAPPASAVVGGSVVATAPPPSDEKVFAWKHGETLNTLKELPKAEGQKLLSRLGPAADEAAGANSETVTVSSDNER